MRRLALLLLLLSSLPALGRAAPNPQTRPAASTVLTEHPSSLRLLRQQFRSLSALLEEHADNKSVEAHIARSWMSNGRQLSEFKRISLRDGKASAKMIDFDGRPMDPDTILEHSRALANSGMVSGIEGARMLMVRIPSASEKSPKDLALRDRIFENVVAANLKSKLAGSVLAVDRLIVPETESLDQLLEVHDRYDAATKKAVDALVDAGKLPTERRAQLLASMSGIQVVPLVESAANVLSADKLATAYLGAYRARYGAVPRHMTLFVAGSDLNREIGPAAGHLLRTVLASRLTRLSSQFPDVDFVPLVGLGSGPMRSGVGRFPTEGASFHAGMTVTVQPDQLDQPNHEEALRALTDNAMHGQLAHLSPSEEKEMVEAGALFADIHAKITLRNALPSLRLANLLQPLNQRGRKPSGQNLVFEKDGALYLRSVHPEPVDAGGRKLDVAGYEGALPDDAVAEHALLRDRARTIEKIWPRGLSDTRAIPGAFARFVGGQGLTTVVGMGSALEALAGTHGAAVAERLRPYITFLVKNDGFVLTKDAALVRLRLSVLHPELQAAQLDRRVSEYLTDVAALERYLGRPVESFTSARDRSAYARLSRRLFDNASLRKYLAGEDLRLDEWRHVMDDVVKLLGHRGWNRVG